MCRTSTFAEFVCLSEKSEREGERRKREIRL
jgi:hypothetical protein